MRLPKLKRCSKCAESKPLTCFGGDKSRPDLLSCWCRVCNAESARRYRNSPSGRAKMRALVKRWRADNPEKTRSAKMRAKERQKARAAEDPEYWSKIYASQRVQRRAQHRNMVARTPNYYRTVRLRERYGMTISEWDALFESQGKACAICSTTESGSRNGWDTDHCHDTGKVRGILCNHCNVALGRIRECSTIAVSMLEYITTRCDPLKIHMTR